MNAGNNECRDIELESLEQHSDDEKDESDNKFRLLEEDFYAELEDLPRVAAYIDRLKTIIRRQQKKLRKICKKLYTRKLISLAEKEDASTQTDRISEISVSPESNRNDWSANIAEEVKETAEKALSSTGFVYEPTSGMYYDYKTGYYYNAEVGLYYDGNSGKYLVYDETTKQFSFHSSSPQSEEVEKLADPEAKRRKVLVDEDKQIEEGELSDTSDDEEEAASGWPPCLRVIVVETSIPGLTIGRLFVVTRDGGTAGREGVPVQLGEVGVSKIHLQFRFIETCYHVIDVGSRNGTWLNDKRISPALQESEPVAISHGDILRLGSTTLLLHVHGGQETCDGCEPGLLQPVETPIPKAVAVPHRTALRDLKKRFGLSAPTTSSAPDSSYTDRAELRRVQHGSSHPAEKTETTCVTRAIAAENKGFKLLSKMGWTEGQTLGINDRGISEPVKLVSNSGHTGLGAQPLSSESKSTNEGRRRQHILEITKKRFEHSSQSPDDKTD